jgi:hypothetical protein
MVVEKGSGLADACDRGDDLRVLRKLAASTHQLCQSSKMSPMPERVALLAGNSGHRISVGDLANVSP